MELVLGGHSCVLAIRITDIGVIRIRFKEFHFTDQGLNLTGSYMMLEEHEPRSSQPWKYG